MKDRKLLFCIIISFIILASLGFSYAYFKNTLENNGVKNNVVETGTLKLIYTDSPEIILENAKPGESITKEISIQNVGTFDVYYKIIWQELINEIINDEMLIEGTCTRINSDGNEEGTCGEISSRVIDGDAIKDEIYIETGVTHKYTLKITFEDTGLEQDYNQGKKFSGVLGINEDKPWYTLCDSSSEDLRCKIITIEEPYADNVSSTYVSSKEGINFGEVSSDTNGKGVYFTTDISKTEDGKRVYYYRGNVNNNYLVFADYCFRIVRTNEGGSVKIRYSGSYTDGKCSENGTSVKIGNSLYNKVGNDNSYVGYMNGLNNSGNSTSYENAHSNKYNSTIKTNIDNWYVNNILSKGDNVKNVVANTVYCNDRSGGNAINAGGTSYSNKAYGINNYFYGTSRRIYKDYSSLGADPTFKCNQSNDKFTLSVDSGGKKLFGNNKLTYPVALLTGDETSYAGLTEEDNTSNYLYTKEYSWTMSPFDFYSPNSNNKHGYIWYITNTGALSSTYLDDSTSGVGVIPVLSIVGTTKVSGIGTSNNPYIVE